MLSSNYSIWTTIGISSNKLLAPHMTLLPQMSPPRPLPSLKIWKGLAGRGLGEWVEMALFCLGGWFCLFIIRIFIIVLCVSTHSVAHVWRSEDTLWESVLSFQNVDSGNQTQAGRMGASVFSHWVILPAMVSGLVVMVCLVSSQSASGKRIWKGIPDHLKMTTVTPAISNFMGTCEVLENEGNERWSRHWKYWDRMQAPGI